jgi:hypothetical protein
MYASQHRQISTISGNGIVKNSAYFCTSLNFYIMKLIVDIKMLKNCSSISYRIFGETYQFDTPTKQRLNICIL